MTIPDHFFVHMCIHNNDIVHEGGRSKHKKVCKKVTKNELTEER